MTPYPKHYLADVPHDLRRQVLDLCILRRWNDAYDLLQQKGFTNYEWYELVWFHDWAPTTLDVNDASRNAEKSPAMDCDGSTPLSIPSTPEPPDASTLTDATTSAPPFIRDARVPPAEPNLNAQSSSVKPLSALRGSVVNPFTVGRRCRAAVLRSKVSKLPEHIRNNLNALLHAGSSSSQVIAWLNNQGYTGFNKVNLHNWRRRGFQDWLRDQNFSGITATQFPGQTSAELKPSAKCIPAVL
jgi:hypothetical protein